MRNRLLASLSLFLPVFLLIFASSAAAQSSPQKGVRVGVTGHPGAAYIGGHMDLKEVARRTWFRPNVEVGVGDGLTLISVNGDFVHFWKGEDRDWKPYFGIGPSLVVKAYNSGRGDSGVGAGGDFVAGVQERKGLLVEVKVGAGDSPRFRAGIGWTW